MSILPSFPDFPEPRRDRPAQTSGFDSFEEMTKLGQMLAMLRTYGAFDELQKYFCDDCEMVCPSPPGLSPFSGVYQGRDAIIQAIKESYALVRFSDIESISTAAEGDTLIINWRAMAHGEGARPAIMVEGMAQLRFRNRRVYHYQNHSDTASMVAMSGFRQEEFDG